MVDCHIHMVLDGVNWKDAIARHKAAPQEALIRQTLGHYQALGFSYLRDGGDRWGVCGLAAKLARNTAYATGRRASRFIKPDITAALSDAALTGLPNTVRLFARLKRAAHTLSSS